MTAANFSLEGGRVGGVCGSSDPGRRPLMPPLFCEPSSDLDGLGDQRRWRGGLLCLSFETRELETLDARLVLRTGVAGRGGKDRSLVRFADEA